MMTTENKTAEEKYCKFAHLSPLVLNWWEKPQGISWHMQTQLIPGCTFQNSIQMKLVALFGDCHFYARL